MRGIAKDLGQDQNTQGIGGGSSADRAVQEKMLNELRKVQEVWRGDPLECTFNLRRCITPKIVAQVVPQPARNFDNRGDAGRDRAHFSADAD